MAGLEGDWRGAREVASLCGADLETPGVVFHAGGSLYRTTGERVGHGGMGNTWHLDHLRAGNERPVRAVAKVFREEFLFQLSQDPAARAHLEHSKVVLGRLQEIRSLHLLPVLCTQPIVDNHLLITPFAGESLVALVLQDKLSAAERVALLLQALRGLAALHDEHIVHADFTLRNVLVATRPDGGRSAILFDYDLCLALDALGQRTYADHYEGRIVGAPEYSVTPEQLDPVLETTPLSTRRDLYAVGTAIYNLFTDASVYGDAEDLPSLLEQIADGVVRQGERHLEFPSEIPEPVRDVICECLERDPSRRPPDVQAVMRTLGLAQQVLAKTPSASGRFRQTLGYVQVARSPRLRDIFDQRLDESVTLDDIRGMQASMARHGYLIEKSLGRVAGHAIYLAQPDPTLVATGRFPEANVYRKIVTAIDLRQRPDAETFLATWLGRIVPILEGVRRAFLTALHKVVVDRPSGHLLLFSEHLDDPRFGTDLARADLTLEQSLALAIILASQIARLHDHGLAHNNVNARSLLFKCLRDTGEVRPVLLGLVEPSFAPEALEGDVRRMAELTVSFVRLQRIDDAAPAVRPTLYSLIERLDGVAQGTAEAPPIDRLISAIADGLAAIDENFQVIRHHGGDSLAYAHTLVRHALYHRLWR
jgi:serine/threonine protein kinase